MLRARMPLPSFPRKRESSVLCFWLQIKVTGFPLSRE